MNVRRCFAAVLLWGVALVVCQAGDAASAPKDLAARGLDVFVHVPEQAGPKTSVPIQVQAYGFPAIDTPVPLPNATIEAVWDPETLGPNVAAAPPGVTTTTNELGHAHLDLPMPAGPERTLRLLVGVRSGGHERTRTATVQRAQGRSVAIHVAESQVVPGSTVPAWVLVRDSTTRKPVPNATIDLSLLEGGVVRSTRTIRTDATGSAIGRVTIPYVDLPSWQWTLRASDVSHGPADPASSAITLTPREETPGKPSLDVDWEERSVRAGGKVKFGIHLRDASEQPVGNHPVRYWVGPKGTSPPREEEAWQKASTLARTDPAGWVRHEVSAPSTVAPVVGTTLTVVARAKLEGQSLASRDKVAVGTPQPVIDVLPEAGALVPAVEQRVLLRVRDERREPIVAAFDVKADGLRTTIETNADGEAQVTWRPPEGIGAYRSTGPCPSGVAAAVVLDPKEPIAALGGRTQPFEVCVEVDRDSPGVVRIEPPVVRGGESVRLRVLGAGSSSWSAVLRSNEDDMAASAWIPDGQRGREITLPEGANGLWSVTVVAPGDRKASQRAVSGLLAIPRVLPVLEAKRAGGRAAPGGTVYVDAFLTDGHGQGMPGSVAAVVYDVYGGGSVRGLWALDTRRRLCSLAGIEKKRCNRFLEGDGEIDAARWAVLANRRYDVLDPALDPAADVQKTIDEAFRQVVHSLEGAVLQSTASPERMVDVRRKGAGGRWEFNPELWTLVTAAMDDKPTTPGGEPMILADLLAVDRQVTFNNVAARTTRLKLFRVLEAVRSFIVDQRIDADEPIMRDPQAIVRRLVRGGVLHPEDLMDPWGGTLEFVRSRTPGLPFLSVRGFALHSPGPDGRVNTGDDIRSPFQRVLRSKTPYAEAVGEDRLVDAKLDMRVADSTVAAWGRLMEKLTGLSLGSIGTVGHGGGTGTGHGYGSGHGRVGRFRRAQPPRVRYGLSKGGTWIPPMRTDADGHVRIPVPLGAVETTWRVGLVGMPDGASAAVAMIDVPSRLPVSAIVDAGVAWIEGDQATARVTVRNRSDKPVRASLAVSAGGVVSLADSKDASTQVEVPARGASDALVRLRAGKPGVAKLHVRIRVPGLPEDVLRQQWDVQPAGERTTATQMAWVDGEADVSLPLRESGDVSLGPVHVVVQRGHEPLLKAALDSLSPDRLRTPAGLIEAVDAAMRIRRWAIARGGEDDPLARRAAQVARRGVGRIHVMVEGDRADSILEKLHARVDLEGLDVPVRERDQRDCPPEAEPTPSTAVEWLEREPGPVGGVVKACWVAASTVALDAVVESNDPVHLASVVLALAERPHRQATASAMVMRLQEQVGLRSNGSLELPSISASDRASRAIVYAALLHASTQGTTLHATADELFAWMAVQRDPYGGYGSTRATRIAVQALLAYAGAPTKPSRVVITQGDKEERFTLGPSSSFVTKLSKGQSATHVRVDGPPVLVKLQRRKLRRWSRVLPNERSPVKIDVAWPTDARAGRVSKVQVTLQHDLGRTTSVDVRLPLPAGARLAAPVVGVRQVQGVLWIRKRLNDSPLPMIIELPIRFDLGGKLTVPEAHARLAFEEASRATAPARPFVVKAR